MIVFLVLFFVLLALVGGAHMWEDARRQREVDLRLARKYGWTR